MTRDLCMFLFFHFADDMGVRVFLGMSDYSHVICGYYKCNIGSGRNIKDAVFESSRRQNKIHLRKAIRGSWGLESFQSEPLFKGTCFVCVKACPV